MAQGKRASYRVVRVVLDGAEILRQASGLRGRFAAPRDATVLENRAPDIANPARGGAAYRPRPGKIMCVATVRFPEIRPLVKRKLRFR